MNALVTLCLFLLLAGAGAATAGTARLPEGAVLVGRPVLAAVDVAALVDELHADLRAGDAAAAIDRLSREHDPLRFEAAAAALIERLRQQASTPAGREWLAWAATLSPRVFARHEETAADWFVPLLPIDERARGTLQLWQRHDASERWRQRFAADPVESLRLAATADAVDMAAAADAIGQLSAPAFERVRTQTATLVDTTGVPAALSLAMARRAPTTALLLHVLQHGEQQQQLAALALARRLSPAEAQTVYSRASEHPALASAATLALAELAPMHPPAMKQLEARLDDPTLGPSAAAALAQLPAADRLQRIESMLGQQPGETRAANLVLALRLEGSPAARGLLQRWADDDRLPQALRREIAR